MGERSSYERDELVRTRADARGVYCCICGDSEGPWALRAGRLLCEPCEDLWSILAGSAPDPELLWDEVRTGKAGVCTRVER